MTSSSNSVTTATHPLIAQWLPHLEPHYANSDPAHDLAHVLRVAGLVQVIAQVERQPERLPLLAALFHDSARALDGANDHEIRSAELATSLLVGTESPANTTEVAGMISRHRFSRPAGPPRTPGEAIFRDADRLDALGFAGIARVYLFLGAHGRDGTATHAADVDALEAHWGLKLKFLADGMHTHAGRRLAEERHRVVVTFLSGMRSELLSDRERLGSAVSADRDL